MANNALNFKVLYRGDRRLCVSADVIYCIIINYTSIISTPLETTPKQLTAWLPLSAQEQKKLACWRAFLVAAPINALLVSLVKVSVLIWDIN